MWFIESSPDGLCEFCRKNVAAEKKIADDKAFYARNLAKLRANNGRPGNQRIFDAFVSKYPDALITGVQVIGTNEKLLVHLDGKPAYYVTFNPLLNSVDLVKYSDALKAEEAAKIAERESQAQAERSKNAGCAVWLAVFGIIYGLVCMIASYLAGFVGMICSAIVLAGGASKSKGTVIFGGVCAFIAAIIGFPLSIGYALFGIFCLVASSDM
jgi:hypothetical protein